MDYRNFFHILLPPIVSNFGNDLLCIPFVQKYEGIVGIACTDEIKLANKCLFKLKIPEVKKILHERRNM